jgi:isoleucyl-tRNA synthetase
MNINWNRSIEEEIKKFWKENYIYEKWILKNEKNKRYIFLEGPPYTTGSPHMGHAYNRTIKDIILRYYQKKGFNVWNQAGFDMHGLPIEVKVEENMKIRDKREIEKIGVDKFIKECFNFAYGSMNEFTKFYEDMAHWQDIDNPYLPIKNEFIERIWEDLAKGYENKLIYKEKKPVWWCPHCQTSLSKQEIDLGYEDPLYKKEISNAIYVKFKSKDMENTYYIVWTTTPWTLLYNLGIMVNPELKYVKIKVPKMYVEELELDYNNHKIVKMNIKKENDYEYWIVAKDILEKIMSKLNIEYEIVDEFYGKDLEFKEYEPLFYDELKDYIEKFRSERSGVFRIWLSKEYVNTQEGTGLVHSAPGCGFEDYEVAKKYNVLPFNTTDETGTILDIKYFEGWVAKKDDYKFILEVLKRKALIYFEWYEHDYPICWRCRNRVIVRSPEQIFINVSSIKPKALLDIENINFIPEAAKRAFINTVKSAPDWVISRQRYWGIPIPMWVDKNGHVKFVRNVKELEKLTGYKFKEIIIVVKFTDYAEKLLSRYFKENKIYYEDEINDVNKLYDVFNKYEDKSIIVVNKFEYNILNQINDLYYVRTYGSRDYEIIYLYNYNLHRPYVDKFAFKCEKCGEEMRRIPDILDVWVDSGSAPIATDTYPVDFITENYDQIKGWFYSLAMMGELYYNDIPYKNVYVGGFVLDVYGRKMSKSLGNVISPYDIINKYGADTMRLYLGSIVEPYEDIKLKWEDIKVKYQILNTLLNISTYLEEYSKYYNVNPAKINVENLRWEDRYMLHFIEKSKKEIYNALDNHLIWKAGRILQDMILELSRFYIKATRERIKKEPDKVLFVIYKSLYNIINIGSIIIPFISEYIYQKLRNLYGLEGESIILEEPPKVEEQYIDEKIEEEYKLFNIIVENALKLRNMLNINIRRPLKTLYLYKEDGNILFDILNNSDIVELLKDYLNVKEIKIDNIEKDYVNAQSDYGIIKIGFDTKYYPELEEEWLYREIRRRLQDIRKENKLRKGQKANIEIYADEKLLNIIKKYKDMLEKDTDTIIIIKDSNEGLNNVERIYEMSIFYRLNIL